MEDLRTKPPQGVVAEQQRVQGHKIGEDELFQVLDAVAAKVEALEVPESIERVPRDSFDVAIAEVKSVEVHLVAEDIWNEVGHRVPGQRQLLEASKVMEDRTGQTVDAVLRQTEVAKSRHASEDLGRKTGDVRPGEIQSKQVLIHSDERLSTHLVTEVVALKVKF